MLQEEGDKEGPACVEHRCRTSSLELYLNLFLTGRRRERRYSLWSIEADSAAHQWCCQLWMQSCMFTTVCWHIRVSFLCSDLVMLGKTCLYDCFDTLADRLDHVEDNDFCLFLTDNKSNDFSYTDGRLVPYAEDANPAVSSMLSDSFPCELKRFFTTKWS